MVSVPAVEISAARLVSVRLATSAERTAASLVPAMWMVTEVRVPSAVATADGAGGGRAGGRGRGAGGAGDGERVGVGRAGGKLVVRRAGRVGPGAGAVDREGAVGAGGGGLGDEGRRAVDVADGERAGGGNIGGQVGLGQVLRGGREDRGVVGAEDVDGDRGQRAVGAGARDRGGVGRAGGKLVVRRAGRVGPGAGGVDREAAVGAGGGGLGDEARRAVDVADGERAGGGNIGGQVGLGQVGHVGREDRGVVGAGDVDGDRGQGAVGAGDG